MSRHTRLSGIPLGGSQQGNRDVQAKRIVFEHGLELRLGNGKWTIWNSATSQTASFDSPALAIEQLRPLRPVLVTESRGYSGDATFLLRSGGGGIFGLAVSNLTQRLLDTHTIYPVHHTAYLVGAAGYHCQQLAEHYARLADGFSRIAAIPGGFGLSEAANFGGEPEPYFEFDAFLGVARRAYDSSRYLLWHRFGKGKGSVPRSLPALLRASSSIPTALHSRLVASWTAFGSLLTEYRDCIHHYVPIDFGLSTASMRRHSCGAWLTTVRIPDNPQARSKNLFTFGLNRDALTYAWELTEEVLEVAVEIADATVPKTGA
jgi:hypothetical protein